MLYSLKSNILLGMYLNWLQVVSQFTILLTVSNLIELNGLSKFNSLKMVKESDKFNHTTFIMKR